MKILLSGGGTAGHINPALAIAGYACSKDKDTEILFIGTKNGLEKTLVPKAGYKIEFVNVEGLSKKISFSNAKSFLHMIIAKQKCKKIIKEFKPDVVVGTGGYVCAPAVMAANSMGIPTLIHEQNVFPGSAVKFLAPNSTVTAISFEDSRKYFKDVKSVLFTGNPIRPSIISCNREAARFKLGIGDKKFVVIFGGSLGAAKINSTALEYIKSINQDDNIKILFATGERNFNTVCEDAKRIGIEQTAQIKITPYINNMDEVMNAADIVVSRSGAITVSELCALGKSAILIPSPNVTHNHQEYNARALSDNGAAVTILEKDLTAKLLKENIDSMLSNDELRKNMGEKAVKISSIDALSIIYNKINEISLNRL